MAKTDWKMGDTVLPDDLNQIGQEINDMADQLNDATSAATPNTIVQRDANGNISVGNASADAHALNRVTADGRYVGRRVLALTAGTYEDLDVSNYDIIDCQTDGGDIIIDGIKFPAGYGNRVRFVKTRYANTLIFKFNQDKGIYTNGLKDLVLSTDDRYGIIEAQIFSNVCYASIMTMHADTVDGWHIYSDISELGLTQGSETMEAIAAAMENSSMLIFSKVSTNTSTAYPANTGLLVVTKYYNARVSFQFFSRANTVPTSWVGYFDSNQEPSFTGWMKTVTFELGTNKVSTKGQYAGIRARATNGTAAEFDGFVDDIRRGVLSVTNDYVELRKYASNGTTVEKRLTVSPSNVLVDGNVVHHAGNLPYETGLFTPDVRFGGSNAGITYVNRIGRYTRIGNVVYWSIDLQLSNKGSATGSVTIEGLPFTSNSGTPITVVLGAVGGISLPENVYGVNFTVLNNDNKLTLRAFGNNISITTGITSSTFTNGTQIRASGFYFI